MGRTYDPGASLSLVPTYHALQGLRQEGPGAPGNQNLSLSLPLGFLPWSPQASFLEQQVSRDSWGLIWRHQVLGSLTALSSVAPLLSLQPLNPRTWALPCPHSCGLHCCIQWRPSPGRCWSYLCSMPLQMDRWFHYKLHLLGTGQTSACRQGQEVRVHDSQPR